MPDYIDVPVETNPEQLALDAFTHLQSEIPGWEPNDGNLETILIEAMSLIAAEVRDIASAVPTEIFRYFGRSLLGVYPKEASYASVNSTWTMIDDAGYTISAGTQVGIRASGDQLIPFQVLQDYVIAPGDTVADPVLLIAVEPGEAGSALGVADGEVELIDTIDYVLSITQEDTTTGGTDAETDTEYLNRLVQRLTLLSPRAIVPSDFEILAVGVSGVERALAIDGYNPDNGTYNNERYVTVAVVDETGAPVSAPVKAEVDALLQSEREINFIVRVVDPTISVIDVNFTAVAYPGSDTAAVALAATEVVEAYLDPANWGYINDTGDGESLNKWVNKTAVRVNEIIAQIDRVPGVDYVSSVYIKTGADAFAASDIILSGIAPLASAGTVTASVVI